MSCYSYGKFYFSNCVLRVSTAYGVIHINKFEYTINTMKKPPELMLTARVPKSLVTQLDKAAKQAHRSRSAEVRVRLQAAFQTTKKVGVE